MKPSDAEQSEDLARIPTGIPAADPVLGGGFVENSINILMGHPGTGKTVLAEQVLFHNARQGERPVLFLSTLSEPLAKVVTYLQEFEFFDPDAVGSTVLYEDLGGRLREEGVDVLLERVKELIREASPRILVIDSFKAIHDMVESPARMRRLVSELGGLLSAYAVTTFLVGEYAVDQIPVYPEFAVADTIVELARRTAGRQDERYLRVLKLRGSSYQAGHHGFRITGVGIELFPRLVTPTLPADYRGPSGRVSTGMEGVDDLLDGGLLRGSSTLVVGPTGTGKTTTALSFVLAGIRSGERVIFLNFQENPTQLERTVSFFGEELGDLTRRGLFLEYASPVELQIDSVVVDLFRLLDEHDIQRVAVDALSDLAAASPGRERLHDYLYSMLQHFAVRGITSLLTLEGRGGPIPLHAEERISITSIADAIMELDLHPGAEPWRSFRIVKARGIAHDLRTREMSMADGRLRVGEPRGRG